MSFQCIRDQLAVTKSHEQHVLSSYVIKTSFLKEVGQNWDEDWSLDTIGQHTINILERIDAEGSTCMFNSFFVKDEPVFLGESNHFSKEARGIVRHIQQEAQSYCKHITVHFIFCLVILVSIVMEYAISHFFYQVYCPISQSGLHNLFENIDSLPKSEIIYLVNAEIITLSITICGMIFINLLCGMTYKLYVYILRAYYFLLTMSMLHFLRNRLVFEDYNMSDWINGQYIYIEPWYESRWNWTIIGRVVNMLLLIIFIIIILIYMYKYQILHHVIIQLFPRDPNARGFHSLHTPCAKCAPHTIVEQLFCLLLLIFLTCMFWAKLYDYMSHAR